MPINLFSMIIGAIIGGFFLKWLSDTLSEPNLEIIGFEEKDIDKSELLKPANAGQFFSEYHIIRAKIQNKTKKIFNNAAENCIGWFKLVSENEKYQLPWSSDDNFNSIKINVGDYQYLNLCGRSKETGKIIIPIDSKYNDFIEINNNKAIIEGEVTITSANGKGDSKKIVIQPINGNKIEVKFK